MTCAKCGGEPVTAHYRQGGVDRWVGVVGHACTKGRAVRIEEKHPRKDAAKKLALAAWMERNRT